MPPSGQRQSFMAFGEVGPPGTLPYSCSFVFGGQP